MVFQGTAKALSWLRFVVWMHLLLAVATSVRAASVLSLDRPTDLVKAQQLFVATPDEAFPTEIDKVSSWLSTHERAERVRLTGGSYWLYGEVRNDTDSSAWVFAPNNTLIEHVEARVYGPDGRVQRMLAGYRHDREYMLHYGKNIDLQPGTTYRVLVRFDSYYFASQPRFEIVERNAYQHSVLVDNLLAVGALGAVAALAIFYFFIYAWVRDKSHLYYSMYLTAFFFGWLFPFQVPTELWGFQHLNWHYVPIFLLPPLCALFCIEFLRLREETPKLAWIVGVPAAFSLVLLPSCFVAPRYAHLLASAIVGIWMPIALIAGIIRWRQGYRPARFFVFAFSAIMVGGAVLLPANLGLMNDVVDNAELMTLLAGTLDAMLLAFALADRIALLARERERYLQRLNHTLQLAQTDALTGVGNRYAFDQALQNDFVFAPAAEQPNRQLLALIDVDGLKQINDKLGHTKGDELLRMVANALRNLLGPRTACYRLGGDEFALIASVQEEAQLRAGIAQVDHMLGERDLPGAGISYGIAYAHESASPKQLLSYADERMYENKSARKRARVQSVSYAG